MQNLISIPCKEFKAFLVTMNGFVSGSSALYSYLSDTSPTDTDPDWKPNDVDVWIPVPKLTQKQNIELHNSDRMSYEENHRTFIKCEEQITTAKTILSMVDLVLGRYDYQRTDLMNLSGIDLNEIVQVKDKEQQKQLRAEKNAQLLKRREEYFAQLENNSRLIYRIYNYKHKSSNIEIQVIMTIDVSPEEIVKNFDLPYCGVIWPSYEQTPTEILEAVQKKECVMTKPNWTAREMQRVTKYNQRGFKTLIPYDANRV